MQLPFNFSIAPVYFRLTSLLLKIKKQSNEVRLLSRCGDLGGLVGASRVLVVVVPVDIFSVEQVANLGV